MGSTKDNQKERGEEMKNMKPLLTKSGKITIAALDHRGSLQRSLNPDNPESVSSEEMREWKGQMVELYKEMVSGILIDPVYGKELVDPSTTCGWMMSMEKSGYRGGKEERETELLPDWDVSQVKALGATGAKLLLYFDPENAELASKQKEIAWKVSEECFREGVVFLLEPLSYKIESSRAREVVEIVKEVSELGADILKIEYPGDRAHCEQISQIINVPWVLLSAGMKFDEYKQALQVACESGASGMAVGRAVWQEFGEYTGEEREKFLQKTSVERMSELVEIVERYGKRVE